MSRPLSIALISETYPPEVNGVANTLGRLHAGLQQLGHRVQVVRPRQPGDDGRRSDAELVLTRIWLLQAPPGEALDSDRLGDWHAALERLQLPHGETSPLAWLETGHD